MEFTTGKIIVIVIVCLYLLVAVTLIFSILFYIVKSYRIVKKMETDYKDK